MNIKLYGTRGTESVSGPNSKRYGGNTTSLRIYSDALGESCLAVDSGTGFLPLSRDYLVEVEYQKTQNPKVYILYTHLHDDHIRAFKTSPLLMRKEIPIVFMGPMVNGSGVEMMIRDQLKIPYFPVEYSMAASHFHFHEFVSPDPTILLFHKTGGLRIIQQDEFEQITSSNSLFKFGERVFPLQECLKVTMHKCNHPQLTICYRFEEMWNGKVFVFLTDHENQSGVPKSFMNHLKGADLLVADCQYTKEQYERTAGFGHSTPEYVAELAKAVQPKVLGLTHHDPFATDSDVDTMREITVSYMMHSGIDVYACYDYQRFTL